MKQFKSLQAGDSVILVKPCQDYLDQLHVLKPGTEGVFSRFVPAVTGAERDFALIDFPGLTVTFLTLSGREEQRTPRCGAFAEDLK